MLLLSLPLLAPHAAALDVDTFSFTGSSMDGQGGLQVEAPTLGWSGAAYGGLGIVYAHNPLMQVFEDGTESALIQDSFATHVLAGYTLLGKIRIDLDFPLYPYVGGQADPALNGVSSGDARLRGVVAIPLKLDPRFRLAVLPTLTLPTGEVRAYTGSGTVGGGFSVAGNAQVLDALAINANVGFHAVSGSALGDQLVGSGLDLGLGGVYALRPDIHVGAELTSVIDLTGGLGLWYDNPLELHAFGRYGRDAGIQALLGVGTGIVGGLGAPDVRVLAGVGYRIAGTAPIYDVDADGIFDDADVCLEIPEDEDGFEDTDGCPEADNDKDSLLDPDDRCPDNAEDIDEFDDGDGCPELDNDTDGTLDGDDACPVDAGPVASKGCPDRDGDTLIDAEDECPEEAGPVELIGCPDRDADLVPDKRDACPDEPKDPREDPARSDGCPKRVFVGNEKIVIVDKIFFDTGKFSIKSQSFPLLVEIAAVLEVNPDIRGIEVAGHTDGQGDDKTNLRLSEGRAGAVVKHLTTVNGVDAGRLTARGYGEGRPIDTNATDAGRSNNRRVDFMITALSVQAPAPPAPAAAPSRKATPKPTPTPTAKPPPAGATPWGTPTPAPADATPWGTPTPAAQAPTVTAPAPVPAAKPAPAPKPVPAAKPAPAPKPAPVQPLDTSKPAEEPGSADDPFGLDEE